MTSSNIHETCSNLLHVCLTACTPSTKIPLKHGTSPYLFRVIPQSCLGCCLPDYSPHFSPNKTEITTPTLCIFSVNIIHKLDKHLYFQVLQVYSVFSSTSWIKMLRKTGRTQSPDMCYKSLSPGGTRSANFE